MPHPTSILRFLLGLLAVLAVVGCAPLPTALSNLGENPTTADLNRVSNQTESLCDTHLGTMPEEMSGFPSDGSGGGSLLGCS